MMFHANIFLIIIFDKILLDVGSSFIIIKLDEMVDSSL